MKCDNQVPFERNRMLYKRLQKYNIKFCTLFLYNNKQSIIPTHLRAKNMKIFIRQ